MHAVPSSEPAPSRVLLVDDQPLFRRAIATLIAEQPDFAVVGEAINGQDAIDKSRALHPDLVVMDIEMPVMDGVEAVRILRDTQPEIKIVVLTVSEDEDYLFDAVRFGAHGYLLKDLQPEQLYEMLRAVRRGETPISPVMAGRLLAEFRRQGEPASNSQASAPAATGASASMPSTAGSTLTSSTAEAALTDTVDGHPLTSPAARILTRRELETLQYVADGMSNKEIGVALSITEGTVKNHVHNALEKLQLENRIQAAAYVVRQGFAHRPETR